MNGKCVAFCSVLVLALLIERTAELPPEPPEPGTGTGIIFSDAISEILKSTDERKKNNKVSSTNLLCYGGTHLCYQLNQENCTCVARGSKCPPDGLELKYLSGRPQSCNAVYNGRSVTGCRCICA
uniref:Dermacentor 9 kDa family member n=1 Tax=Rhipicephalus zambeziensis TaxID=60191 RepID=A0A224YCN7_9ACAR